MFSRDCRGLAFNNRDSHSLAFRTLDAEEVSGSQSTEVLNLVQGEWKGASRWTDIVDPLNGQKFIAVPDLSANEIKPFVESLHSCPKSGLHNPLKNPERYVMYGDISARAAAALKQPEVSHFFCKIDTTCVPQEFCSGSW